MEEIGEEEEEEEEVTSVCEMIVLVEETTELVEVVDDVVLGITSVDEIEVELSISEEVVEGTISSLEVVEETAAEELLCTALVVMVELDVSLDDALLMAELARVLLDVALMPLLTLLTLLTLLRIAVVDVAAVEEAAASSAAMEARVPLSTTAPARGRRGRLASATARARAWCLRGCAGTKDWALASAWARARARRRGERALRWMPEGL